MRAVKDITEDIAKTLLFRNMEVPDSLKEVLDELLEETMEISAAAKDMIEQLHGLLQIGFRGREQKKYLKRLPVNSFTTQELTDNSAIYCLQKLFGIGQFDSLH